MKIAVVGAGWAGLAAATRLHQQGHDVRLFEAAAAPGGRARTVHLPALDLPTDNGPHLLLGAYCDTFALMQSLGLKPEDRCLIQPLDLQSADQQLRLRFWPLPAPWHRLGAVFGSRGLSGWRGRRHLAKVLKAAHPTQIAPHLSLSNWLTQLDCPPALLQRLWAPLCLAATNTPIAQTDARLFAQVLRDSLAADASASQLVIPHGTLHELWPQTACEQLGNRLQRRRVQKIGMGQSGNWLVDDESYGRVILAVPPGEARRLLQPLPHATDYLAHWPQWQHAAIATLNLRLETPWHSGMALGLLWDEPAQHAWGQWFFDRSTSKSTEKTLVQVVIGRAESLADEAPEQILAGVLAQLQAQCQQPLPPLKRWALITEKRATFDVTPGLSRPGTLTPWPGLLLAGDWTDTGYPAVLEGAVRSGLHAAAMTQEPGSASQV
ncbi:hydroxysqualene dehydroxylase HpnE [Castellaniella sp.]|uniref:hydroxysqualene dehydroxylase HpnE n=1 Tax=Castellaniella sp. TaxID=1955812 RepID=UPI002AFE643D|nr:hydroxysqualene dehydroxylase HpnE [Castellaniella sp.]